MEFSREPIAEQAIVARLRAAGCVFAEDEAALILGEAHSPEEVESMVSQRVAGLPLEQVVGWAEFYGLRIVVEPTVFVPRRRTQFLVNQAVALASPGAVVVDMCCGSGAVGAAILTRVPTVELYASDIDPAAVRAARRNIGDRGSVFEGDLYDSLPVSLRGRVDILVANAPYVPTDEIHFMPPEARDFEARVALDGGEDGLDIQRRIAADATSWLAPGGHLLVETSERQAPLSMEIFAAAGLTPTVAYSEELSCTVVIGTVVIGTVVIGTAVTGAAN
jgi:release factor glutamine methyltransferase